MRNSFLHKALIKERKKSLSDGEHLISEARSILVQNSLDEKHVLENLKFYNSSFEFLDDKDFDYDVLYSRRELERICIRYRLRFADSQRFTGELPYEVLLKIKDLNSRYGKDLRHFKILAHERLFLTGTSKIESILFAETICGNYFPVHNWGNQPSVLRQIKVFPLRNFESLAICLLVLSGIFTLILPNHLISSDPRADYFSMYRMAAYFHILIINTGFSVFLMFGFKKHFSGSVWDNHR